MLNWFSRLTHGILDWHIPDDEYEFDGISIRCHCRFCKKPIARDSQGNWFIIEGGNEMKKVYIHDFCEDLNYKGVIVFVNNDIPLEDVLAKLKESNISHLNRFECVKDNRLFYIENCDLQEVTIRPDYNELCELLENDYSVLQLCKDTVGFYISIPNVF